MAYGQVSRYVVSHRIGGDWEVVVYVGNVGYSHRLGEAEARLLIDTLRNEGPLWYDPDTRRLTTGYETPGEGEGAG